MAERCKNITLPQTSFAGGNNLFISIYQVCCFKLMRIFTANSGRSKMRTNYEQESIPGGWLRASCRGGCTVRSNASWVIVTWDTSPPWTDTNENITMGLVYYE